AGVSEATVQIGALVALTVGAVSGGDQVADDDKNHDVSGGRSAEDVASRGCVVIAAPQREHAARSIPVSAAKRVRQSRGPTGASPAAPFVWSRAGPSELSAMRSQTSSRVEVA